MKIYYSILTLLIVVSGSCFLFEIHPATRRTELGYANTMQGICLVAGLLAFTFQAIYLRIIRKKEREVILHTLLLGVSFYALIHILDAAFYHASWHPEKSKSGLWIFQIMMILAGFFYTFSLIPKAILHLKNKRMANQTLLDNA